MCLVLENEKFSIILFLDERKIMMFYVVFALIIVALCTIAGINEVSEANKKLKKCYRGVVIKCDECESPYVNSAKQYYEVLFEIDSVEGTIQRCIKTNIYYKIGSEHDVYCDEDKTLVEDISSIKKDRSNGMVAFIPGTVLLFLISAWALNLKFGLEMTFIILGIVLVVLGLIFVIVSMLGITKNKKSYKDLDVYRVNGKVVSHIYYGGNSYTSVYEFYDNGVRRTIESSMDDGQRLSVRRPIGSEVVIVINRNTKEVYCENDIRRQKYINKFAVAMLICIIICVLSVFIK